MNTRFLVVSMWNKPGEGKISPSFQDTIKQTWSHERSHFTPWCQHGWNGRVHRPVNVSNRLAASALHKQLRPTFSVFDRQNEQTNKRAYSYQLGQCWCLKPPLLYVHSYKGRCSDKYVHSQQKEPCLDSQAGSPNCIALSQKVGYLWWLMAWWHGCCKWIDVDGHQHVLQ